MPGQVDYTYVFQLIAMKQSGSDATNTLLLDVRDLNEVARGSIPYAINISFNDGTLTQAFALDADAFQKRFGVAKPASGDRIVSFCGSGNRGASAAKQLEALGYTNVFVYGYKDWAAKSKN